jgi:hypothetical protein
VYRAIKGARRRKCVRDVCVRPRVCVCQYSRMRVFNEGIVAINNTCVVCQMNKAWPTQHREGWTDGIAYGMHTSTRRGGTSITFTHLAFQQRHVTRTRDRAHATAAPLLPAASLPVHQNSAGCARSQRQATDTKQRQLSRPPREPSIS